MSIPGIGRLKQAARRLRDYFTPRVVLLMYHRVVALPADPPLLTVTPQHFAEHMEVLRRHGCCMSLQQLASRLRAGRLPRRAVVVTFDDGYADNLLNAKPLLERCGLPATVFVATGLLGTRQEFWWDELERLLLLPGDLPGALRLRFRDSTFEADLGPAARYSEEDCERHRGWNDLHPDPPGPRQAVYRALRRQIRPCPAPEQQEVLDQLRAWAGASPEGRPSHRVMSPEEVNRLADGGLVEIGAHTRTHPVLAAQPAAEQAAEVRQSKARLEELLGRPVVSFAYPFGSVADYSADTVAAVREAGLTAACSTYAALVERDTDPLQLPRMMVLNWDGEEFRRRLSAWLT